MARFFAQVAATTPGAPAADAPYREWHAWSIASPGAFWAAMWQFGGVVAERQANGSHWSQVVQGADRMAPPDATRGPVWFAGAQLNFAENMLQRRGTEAAIIARDERGVRREISRDALRADVARVAAAFRAMGVVSGDRVAGFLPNIPEAVVAMLAAASIGAVWSSCSPDFGVGGVFDRFGQIAPRVLVVADGYRYAGKSIDCMARAREIVERIDAIEHVVVVSFLSERVADTALDALRGAPSSTPRGAPRSATRWEALGHGSAPAALDFARLPFDHPLFVMYSSGTTGLPKCMVHGAGGTLLQHLKEHQLHTDLRDGDRIFYFTTCGWMMWNWLVSALASGAAIVLYDGAPMPPSAPDALWTLAADERVTVFGTSAKFLALSEKEGFAPQRTHDLSALRTILSTGSPLAPASFAYVYRDVQSDVHLASISGGTDIISCFALGNPMLPVWQGELQSLGLGMAVDVWDAAGEPLALNPGDLVCTRPFPSMPVAFWNDADGSKYRKAYFDFFPGVWRHGDWALRTAHDGLVILGRSDATLNPGGVRIGTAEIYRQVEQVDEVLEAVVVGQEITVDGSPDVRIVLFVRLRAGVSLDDTLRDRLKRRIREQASPHHVPRVIVQVADIPRTISGKISEIAVRETIHGRSVDNTDALANPESLALYRAHPSLALS